MDHDDYGLGGGDMEVLVQLRRFWGEGIKGGMCQKKRTIKLSHYINYCYLAYRSIYQAIDGKLTYMRGSIPHRVSIGF